MAEETTSHTNAALPIGEKVRYFTVSQRPNLDGTYVATHSCISCPYWIARAITFPVVTLFYTHYSLTMAALVRYGVLKTGQVKLPQNGNINVLMCRYATKAEKKKGIDRKVPPKIDSTAQSLATKGFLRPQKEYSPPSDLKIRLESIIQKVLGTTEKTTELNDVNTRFALFTACNDEFKHYIPNSLLHTIETVDDVYRFYETTVSVATPLDRLRTMELPKNLHVQYEYLRFHPDTDTKFGGITAFPKSSTIVTGLKYKDKYKGHIQSSTWPYTSYK